jgi:hypothetical protein
MIGIQLAWVVVATIVTGFVFHRARRMVSVNGG